MDSNPVMKSTFITGAQRVETDIPNYHSIPPWFLRELALVFSEGERKYGDRNWEQGLPTESTVDHMLEHLMRWAMGDRTEPHMAKIAWNAMAIEHAERSQNPALLTYDWSPNRALSIMQPHNGNTPSGEGGTNSVGVQEVQYNS